MRKGFAYASTTSAPVRPSVVEGMGIRLFVDVDYDRLPCCTYRNIETKIPGAVMTKMCFRYVDMSHKCVKIQAIRVPAVVLFFIEF